MAIDLKLPPPLPWTVSLTRRHRFSPDEAAVSTAEVRISQKRRKACFFLPGPLGHLLLKEELTTALFPPSSGEEATLGGPGPSKAVPV